MIILISMIIIIESLAIENTQYDYQKVKKKYIYKNDLEFDLFIYLKDISTTNIWYK
jgi:hypothetical protein